MRNTVRFVTTLFLLLLFFTPFVSADDWYDTNWKYRQEITISSALADSDLDYFPILVKISNLDATAYDTETDGIFTSSQADGDDLVFTSSNGITKIPHEIEYYENDSGVEELYAWVQVPTLDSLSDTTIYMYYGNLAASNQENVTAVWDDNYVLVMHLGEDVADGGSTGIHYDSTANSFNGVQGGNALEDHTSGGENKIAGGQRFDTVGTDGAGLGEDYLSIDNVDSDDWTEYSLSAWFNNTADDYDGDPRIICKTINDIADFHIFTLTQDNSKILRTRISIDGDGNATEHSSSLALAGNTWYYGSIVWEGTGTNDLRMGRAIAGTDTSVVTEIKTPADDDTGDGTLTDANEVQNVIIGNHIIDGYKAHQGVIDEVRISNIARSEDWVNAEFRNGDTPGDYQSFQDQVYVAGTVYSDRGSTPMGSGTPVSLSIDGGTITGTDLFSGTTDSTGRYFIAVPRSSLTGIEKLIAFLDTDGGSQGAVVTSSDGENLEGLDIYQNHLIPRNDNGGDPSVADFSTADNGDTDIPYTVPAGLSVTSGIDLYIPSGTSFIPANTVSIGTADDGISDLIVAGSMTLGGALITGGSVSGSGSISVVNQSLNADAGIFINTLSVAAGSVTVAGDWNVSNFTPGTGSVVFDGTGSVFSESFNNLELDSTGTLTAAGALTVNSLTLTAGTFDPGNYIHSITGDWNDSLITFSPSEGSIQLNSNAAISQGAGNQFYNLILPSGATTSSDITVGNDLTINGGILNGTGDTINLGGNWINNVGLAGYTGGGSGTVRIFDNTRTTSITGENLFYNFTVDGEDINDRGKTVLFNTSYPTEITNSFTATGENWGSDDNTYVTLKSSSDGTQASLEVSSLNESLSYVFLQDLIAADPPATSPLVATTSVDGGNNTNWNITTVLSTDLWNGGSTAWADGANWDNNANPPEISSVDIATIPGDAPLMPVMAGVTDMGSTSVIIGSGAVWDLAGWRTEVENIENQGTIRVQPPVELDSGNVPNDNDSGTFQFYGADGPLYDDSQDFTSNDFQFYNLEVTGSGYTYSLNENDQDYGIVVNGDLLVDEATLTAADGGSGADDPLDLAGDLNFSGSGTFQAASASHSISGSVSGVGTFAVDTSTSSVGGGFTVTSVSSGAGSLTVNGDWSPGSYLLTSGTVVLDGDGSVSSGTFNNMTVSSGIRTAAGDISLNGNLLLNGTLDMGSYDLTVTGSVTGSGTLISGSGDIDVDGLSFAPSNFTDSSGIVTVAQDWGVSALYTPGTTTVYFDSALASLSQSVEFFNMVVQSSAVLNIGDNALFISNTFNNLGEIRRNGGSIVNQTDQDSGLTTYITTGTVQTYTGPDYYNLGFAAGAAVSLSGDTEVSGRSDHNIRFPE